MSGDPDTSPRRRILEATFAVLSRSGPHRLHLSDVAAEAGVSRPTLYRYFGSKEGLLDSFALYEQDNFDVGVAAAMAGLQGPARLDAALRFIVSFQDTYSLARIIDTEPEWTIAQMHRVLPLMCERIRVILTGEKSDVAASAVVRIAVSHYLIRDNDPGRFLAELRHAAGLDPTGRRRTAYASGVWPEMTATADGSMATTDSGSSHTNESDGQAEPQNEFRSLAGCRVARP